MVWSVEYLHTSSVFDQSTLHLSPSSLYFSAMDDPELARLRAQRMAELRGKQPGGGISSEEQAEDNEKQRQEQEMAKNSILSQVSEEI